MKCYPIKRFCDGPDWQQIPVLSIDTPYLRTRSNVRSYAQIGYTAEALFLHLWIDVPQVRAVETGMAASIWEWAHAFKI